MYNIIREKKRQEIRQEQIQQYFKEKREEHLQAQRQKQMQNMEFEKDCQHLYWVIREGSDSLDLKVVQKLIELVQKFGERQNTYILVRNYLLQHASAFPYLKPYLLGNQVSYGCYSYAQLLQFLIASAPSEDDLKLYDEEVCRLIGRATNEDQMLIAVSCFKGMMQVMEYWPSQSMHSFCQRLHTPISHYHLKLLFYDTMCCVWEYDWTWMEQDPTDMYEEHMGFMVDAIWYLLKEFESQQGKTLSLVSKVFFMHRASFISAFIAHPSLLQTFESIFYHTPSHRPPLMLLWYNILSASSIHQILYFLHHHVHHHCLRGINDQDIHVTNSSLLSIQVILFDLVSTQDQQLQTQLQPIEEQLSSALLILASREPLPHHISDLIQSIFHLKQSLS